MKRIALFLFVVLAACATATRPGPQKVYLTTATVASSDVCMNIDNCPAFAPYFRAFEDQGGQPVWWLVSTDNRACPVTPQVFTRAEAIRGTVVACAWRAKRGAP